MALKLLYLLMMKENQNPAHILVVEDDGNLLKVYKTILKKDFYPICAKSGKEALKLILMHKIDLVLLDIWLPDMNGIDILKDIKKLKPEIEIIMVTAVKNVKSVVKAMQKGAYHYIEKPFDNEELINLIKQALTKKKLSLENRCLKSIIAENDEFKNFIGKSSEILRIKEFIKKISHSDANVLISGESGTGKEVVAHSIHQQSLRRKEVFIPVNCAAIPENLFESELFGHERGSFTGAIDKHPGKFEIANQGSIFLDEISSLPLKMQAKLLRVLQNREIERIGSHIKTSLDIRIIAASNANLVHLIKEKEFRTDLYYRLNVIPIHLPPLRERREDIPLLAKFFLRHFNQKLHKKISSFSHKALKALTYYHWPGNVRELKNLIERLVVITSKEEISRKDLPHEIIDFGQEEPKENSPLFEFLKRCEMEQIRTALKKAHGNQSHAAKILGIHRTTLVSKLKSARLREKQLLF